MNPEHEAKARRQRQKIMNYALVYGATPAEIQASLEPWKGAPKGSRQQRRLARTRRMQWHRRCAAQALRELRALLRRFESHYYVGTLSLTADAAPILDWKKV